MLKYKFYSTADKQLDGIFQYTLKEWGQNQAEKYIRQLYSHIKQTAEKKVYWHKLPAKLSNPFQPDIQLYFTKFEKHYIFFRKLSRGKIGIISILHEKMSFPIRLKQDLETISKLN